MMAMSWSRAMVMRLTLSVTVAVLLLLAGCSAGVGNEDVGSVESALCSGTSLSASPSSPAAIGTVVTLTASGTACGAVETPEYRYYYVKNGQSSISGIIKDWSTAKTAQWNTTGLTSGEYQLIVNTRAVGTSSYSTTYLPVNYQIGNVCNSVTSFTTSPTSPQNVGTLITLTAAASCTGGTAEYQFFYLEPGASSYTAIGAFGSASQTWNTAGRPTGSYTLLVHARAVGNTGSESSRYSSYTLGPAVTLCTNASLAVSPSPPQSAGTQVTLTGSASSCPTPQFLYYYRLFGGNWTTIGTWTTGTVVWNTTGLANGTYQVAVNARQSGSTGGGDTSDVKNFGIGGVCSSVTLSSSPPSPQAPGVQVNLTSAATCSGGATPEYLFQYRISSNSNFTVLRTWGASTVSWDTTGLAAGAYYVQVLTRASGSTVPYDSAFTGSYTLGAQAITQISASLGYHTCARINDGTVRCWGANDTYQLGTNTVAQSAAPITVSGLSNVASVAAGVYHTVALLGDGTVRSWGLNSDGQLGNNSTTQSASPVVASGLSGVLQVSAGTAHSCARLSGGSVYCWGNGRYGQIGSGGSTTLPYDSYVPVAVPGISGASDLAAGGFHTCAIVSGGVSCWGDNSAGQMGGGTTAQTTLTPVTVPGITGATAVAAGDSHSCVLVGGTVQCWGDNTYGQLGNGSTGTTTSVVTVPGISTATAVSAGFTFSCALLSNKTVRCWGRNVEGELGDGSGVDKLAPTTVSGINTANQLSTGGLHACVALSSGGASCWGYNANGPLGNGTTTNALSPVSVLFP